jgi:hypothetical protein
MLDFIKVRLSLIRDAAKNVRAVKWALAIAAVAASASLVGIFFGGGFHGVVLGYFASLILFPLITAMLLFSIASGEKLHAESAGIASDEHHREMQKLMRPAAIFMIYAFTLMTIAAAILTLTSVFFGRPLDLTVHPNGITPQAPIPTVMVHVPAATPILDGFDPSKVIEDQEGFFYLPAHSTAQFQSAQTLHWGNDPLDSIEGFLSQNILLWDASEWEQEYKDCGSNDDMFQTKYIVPTFENLVKEGIASDRKTPERALVQAGIKAYIYGNILPSLKNPATFIEGKYILVDVRDGGGTFFNILAGKQFWKRILAEKMLQAAEVRSKVFGPYFDVAATGGSPPSSKNRGFPTMEANSGALVARAFTLVGTSNYVTTAPSGLITKFCDDKCTLDNETDERELVRLGMNDDIPEDNGSGYADVVVAIHQDSSRSSR